MSVVNIQQPQTLSGLLTQLLATFKHKTKQVL